MANLTHKTLKFTKLFRGFNLKVEVTCVPVTNDPRNQYDYNITNTSVFTTSENTDINLLIAAYEKILFDIEVYVLEHIHSMYMEAHNKDLYQYRLLHSNRADYEDQRLQEFEKSERDLVNHFEH